MRASVETGSYLTGSLFVSLDFDGDAPLNRRGPPTGPFEIPTVPSGTEAMVEAAGDLMTKLRDMPVEKLMASATRTLQTAERVAKTLEKNVETLTASLTETANAASGALGAVQGAVPTSGKLQSELGRTLKELADAAASIRMLAEVLTRQPESLIRGRR